MKKKYQKPSEVLKLWETELEALKSKISETLKGRQKATVLSKQSSKLAKKLAKLAGMKSMGEVKCAADMESRGIPYSYETETFVYQYEPQHYTPDFVLYAKKGKKLYVEYKGKMDAATRKKILAVKSSNPGIVVALVFENANNGITKRRKKKDGTYNVPTKYWQWAEKHGIMWSEHTIKDEWI